jgi:hypothetical protein
MTCHSRSVTDFLQIKLLSFQFSLERESDASIQRLVTSNLDNLEYPFPSIYAETMYYERSIRNTQYDFDPKSKIEALKVFFEIHIVNKGAV